MMSSSGDAHNSARKGRLKCIKKIHNKQHEQKADLTNVAKMETSQSEIMISKQSVIKHVLNARSLQQDSNEVIPNDIKYDIQLAPSRKSCFHDDLSRRMLLIGQSTLRRIETLTKSIGCGGNFLASLNSYDYRNATDSIHFLQGMVTVLPVIFSIRRLRAFLSMFLAVFIYFVVFFFFVLWLNFLKVIPFTIFSFLPFYFFACSFVSYHSFHFDFLS